MSDKKKTLEDIRNSVSCVDAINAIFWCGGPTHQFDRYYKDGKLDSCSQQWNELKFCIQLKWANPQETKTLIRQLLVEDNSPTIGTVWNARNNNSKAEAQ